MNIYFRFDPVGQEPQAYRYPVEQMLLTLFPLERPVYPEGGDWEGEGQGVLFTLSQNGETAIIRAALAYQGQLGQGELVFPSSKLQEDQSAVYYTLQYGLKMTFYQAATSLLGKEPPWGALTGVRPVQLPLRAMAAGASPDQARRELEQRYHVSPQRALLATDCAQEALQVMEALHPHQVSLYVGIPFCPSRCSYCSFVSADVGRTLALVEPYLEGLREEIQVTGEVMREMGLSVHTFYMGGGTPTVLSARQMDQLLTCLEEQLPLSHCVERTVEAGRPDTIQEDKLICLKDHGIERISINPQSLQPRVLEEIGRKHSAQECLECVALARKLKFHTINMDLIAGLPGDDFQGFSNSLEGVLALRPENITIHTLARKKGARLTPQGRGEEGEQVIQMLHRAGELLPLRGYAPYYLYRQKYMAASLENVGWSLAGHRSLYNVIMMEELQSVWALGAGGMTKLRHPNSKAIHRLPNPKYPQDYLAALPKVLARKRSIATTDQP